MNDYYSLLEVEPTATQEQIKTQYRFLVQAWHPDKFGSPESKVKAEEKLKRINEAYDILKDPIKRDRYDRGQQKSASGNDNNARAEYERQRYEQEARARAEAERLQREKVEAQTREKEEYARKVAADRIRQGKVEHKEIKNNKGKLSPIQYLKKFKFLDFYFDSLPTWWSSNTSTFYRWITSELVCAFIILLICKFIFVPLSTNVFPLALILIVICLLKVLQFPVILKGVEWRISALLFYPMLFFLIITSNIVTGILFCLVLLLQGRMSRVGAGAYVLIFMLYSFAIGILVFYLDQIYSGYYLYYPLGFIFLEIFFGLFMLNSNT